MNILKKILSFVFVITFLLSIVMNISLFMSSSNRLALKDDSNTRLKLYYSANFNLTESKYLTIIAKKPYNETQTSVDEAVCTLTDASKSTYSCKQISKLYESDGTLVRTSYFPGDGYKYSLEGETRTKTEFSNEALESYFKSLVAISFNYLSYLVYDLIYTSYAEFFEAETDVDFNFNYFSLDKEIEIEVDQGTTKFETKFNFDGKDRLTKVVAEPYYNFELNYEKNELQFPSFNNYVAQ